MEKKKEQARNSPTNERFEELQRIAGYLQDLMEGEFEQLECTTNEAVTIMVVIVCNVCEDVAKMEGWDVKKLRKRVADVILNPD